MDDNMIRGRAPVLPIDVENNSSLRRAKGGEIAVNYTTKNIYLIDKKDPTKLIDITQAIKDNLDKINGGNIEIELENGEKTTLLAILNELVNNTNNFQLVDTEEDVSYVFRDNVTDINSIEVVDGNIQVRGFKDAKDTYIPQKRNGVLTWVPMVELTDNGSSNGGSTSSDITALDSPYLSSNTIDGLRADAVVLQPVEDTLYLKASKRQKSLFLDRDYKINLPITVDEFVEIQYFIYTNEYVPTFEFPDNIFWQDKAKTIKPNSIGVYNFKSCDNGRIWMASLSTFDNSGSDTILNVEYLEKNFYTKKEIDTILKWDIL